MKPMKRSRARQACRACNSRRVRCNVVETQPCAKCKEQEIPCELRESRRGRHRRRVSSQNPSNSDNVNREHSEHQDHHAVGQQGVNLPTVNSATDCQPASQQHQSGPGLSTPPAPTPESLDQSFASTERTQTPPEAPLGSEEEIQEHCGTLSVPPLPQPQQHDDVSSSQGHRRPEDEETVFLGESTAMRYLNVTQPSPVMLSSPPQGFFHRVPEASTARCLTSQWELERKQARLRLLELEGAFSFPDKPAVHKVLTAYFQWFHPCFAIVDEPDIWDQYNQKTLSPLLLQAMLFIGVMHCSEKDLHQVGLGSRPRAKYILYNRAKSLFDAEAEPKTLTVIQALFLMSFWRAGALLQKDSRHWLAIAVSQAQTKGLHRFSRDTKDKVYKLRKRVWWAIYVRERQCAAALGLPNRVRDEDCDVETLNEHDFQHAFDPSVSSSRVTEAISFNVGMTYLSRMLGKIIHRDYLPSKRLSCKEREELNSSLVGWKSSLPACMQQLCDGPDSRAGFLAGMLQLAYNSLLILLFRPDFNSIESSDSNFDGRVAIKAAARNSSIIEHMMAENQMRHGQSYIITNVFHTLCIHVLHLRTLQGGPRLVAEHRAKLCLSSLQELQQTWEFTNWILQLFFQYLDRPTALSLQLRDNSGQTLPLALQEDTAVSAASQSNGRQLHGQDENLMGPLHTDTDGFPGVTWSADVEHVGQFLHTQIEDSFVYGEGGAVDWFMADMFNNAFPP